jgi:uncharacterized protein YndB with AHSA1/START domain
MSRANRLSIEPVGEREIRITRLFNAPREMVFDAFTTPELMKRWLLGPDGWSLIVCDLDLKVGGAYRLVWKNDKTGTTMGMGGFYREISRPARLVTTEKFDEAWYPGEMIDTAEFVERYAMTTYTSTQLYESREARDMVMKSDMESGLVASYDRLENILGAAKK